MLFWIFAGLGVYLVSNFLPAVLRLPSIGIAKHVGARDDMPPPGVYVGRARRAQTNMHENFPFFVVLAILALVVDGTDMAQAIFGAQLFVFGRIAYTVAYLTAIPWARSAIWGIGFVGCIVMAMALV